MLFELHVLSGTLNCVPVGFCKRLTRGGQGGLVSCISRLTLEASPQLLGGFAWGTWMLISYF